MKIPSSLGRQALQQLLANAFAVQESQIDPKSLADIMEVQRSIARDTLDLDGAMRHIVESARNVANATGVAIGLLNGGRLTYRAGSGSSAAFTGEHVTASLTVSASTRTSREILRVENAHTDTRIEADICRQFGADALLILPIYCNQALAGVLEVLFSEAHVFQESEVRTYRLMVEQIEAAILKITPQEQAENLSAELSSTPGPFEPIPPGMDDIAPAPDFLMLPENEHSLYARCGAVLAAMIELPLFKQSAALATTLTQRAKTLHWPRRQRDSFVAPSKDFPSFFKRSASFATSLTQRAKNITWPDRWRNWPTDASRTLSSVFKHSALLATTFTQRAKNLSWKARQDSTQAALREFLFAFRRAVSLASQRAKNIPWPIRRHTLGLSAIALVLAVTVLFAYRSRGPAKSLESSTLSNSNTVDQQTHLLQAQPRKGAASLQPTAGPSPEAGPTGTALKRVRVGPNEVDYIGQDVTVRIFEDKRAIKRSRVPAGRVSHYGDDVTVRYFTPLPVTTKTASR